MNARLALVLCICTVIVAGSESVRSQPAPTPNRAYGHGSFLGELRAPRVPANYQQQEPIAEEQSTGALTREVLGYLPYWSISGGYTVQRWDLLTILAWFAAEMDASGNVTDFHGWGGATTAALVEEAHAHGVKVVVTVTNFNDADIDTLLQSPIHRAIAIQSCLDLMATHGADGVNIDFEFVPLSARDAFVTFMTDLKAAVVQAQPNGGDGHVSLAGPSVDWTGAYDYDQLLIHTDGIMVMAYGYHYGGGNPGPTSPLVGGGGLSNYSVSTTIEEYLEFGGYDNRHKVLIGLPWYGRRWKVANTDIPGVSLGTSSAVFFDDAQAEANSDALEGGPQWHEPSKTAWYHVNKSDGLYQVWYDDGPSFDAKVAYVDSQDLGGIGIWALGYDGQLPDLWAAISSHLVEPTEVSDAGPEAAPDMGPEPAVEVGPEAVEEVGGVADVGQGPPDTAAEDTAGPFGPELNADAGPSSGAASAWSSSGSSSVVRGGTDTGCAGGRTGPGWWALFMLIVGLCRSRLRVC